MRVLGLDEAGRGCVLGPLVVGAFCPTVDDDALRALGVTDSKALSPRRREAIAAALPGCGRGALRFISPAEIDAGNVNALEEAAFVDLIAEFAPHRVLLDAPVHPGGIPALVARLSAALTARGAAVPEILAEPKADLHHRPVGAASILAKVARDREIAALGPVGSGYPSDPTTLAYLRGFLTRGEPFPAAVRQRWGTVARLRGEGP